MIVERAETIRRADAAGIFLVGEPVPAGASLTMSATAGAPLRAFLVAGEESGDQLGAGLMRGLVERLGGNVAFAGVGGSRMEALGLAPLFPFSDLALHGITAVITQLPRVVRRMRETVAAVIAEQPDVLVVIDSPDFNLRVARRVHAKRPDIPIVDYVSPTVWAWRPGRAPWMAGFVDHVMALLPFEPEAHRRLGGPPCTYVGHPLVDRLASLRPAAGERPPLGQAKPTVLLLPGSRHSEVSRLLAPFGEAVAEVVGRTGPIELLLPAVPHLVGEIRAADRKLAGAARRSSKGRRRSSPLFAGPMPRLPRPARRRWNSPLPAFRWSSPTGSIGWRDG